MTCIESVIKIGSNSEILPVCLSKCVGLSIILKRPLTTTISFIVVGRFTIKFNDELDVNNACSNFTDAFLTIAKECIPTREVTIRTDDKMWFDSNLRRESRRRDRLRKAFLRTKTVSAEKQYKQQRNRVNNLKSRQKNYFMQILTKI
jgi:hypothetical protein